MGISEATGEFFVKEKENRPSKTVELANPRTYELARGVDNSLLLEESERQFIDSVLEIATIQDNLINHFFPKDNSWESVPNKDSLMPDFERKVAKINYPISPESDNDSEIFEKPEEPLKLNWQFCNENDFAKVERKFGFSGLLSLSYVQNSVLNELTRTYNHFLSLQGVGPHAANFSPESKKPIRQLQYQALDKIVSTLPKKPEITLDFESIKTSDEFEAKLNQIAESNFDFSVFQDEKDQMGDTIFRKVSTFTIDPQTGMKFVVETPFRCQHGKTIRSGRMSVQAIDATGKSYFFGNSLVEPKYNISSNDSHYRPFYLPKNDSTRDIWQSYCRSVCDVDATKKHFAKEGEWKYKSDEIYFGQQLEEVEKYREFRDKFKLYKLIEGAKVSDLYRVRLGMFPKEGSDNKAASIKNLTQIKTLVEEYWSNQLSSQLFAAGDENSVCFNYPYGKDASFYPDDFGLSLQIIITKNGILIQDAYDPDLGMVRTKYLKVEFTDRNQWKIERGMVERPNDTYFYKATETKNELNEFDAQTVITTLNLLSSDKKERNPDSLLKSPKVDGEIVKDATFRILKNLGLTWSDLDNKKVLDVGAGTAKLARAAKQIGSTADIYSVDEDEQNIWSTLPPELKRKCLIASAEALPFSDNSFDLIVNNGSIKPNEITDEIRILKSGGEIRVAPIGGFTSEIWTISYFLEKYEHWTQEKIEKATSDLEKKVIESETEGDGVLPTDFTELRDTAFETLTQGEKNDLIESLVERYSKMLGVPLSYRVKNPNDFQPEGYVFYQKP